MPSCDLRTVRNLVIRVVLLTHKAHFNKRPVLSEICVLGSLMEVFQYFVRSVFRVQAAAVPSPYPVKGMTVCTVDYILQQKVS